MPMSKAIITSNYSLTLVADDNFNIIQTRESGFRALGEGRRSHHICREFHELPRSLMHGGRDTISSYRASKVLGFGADDTFVPFLGTLLRSDSELIRNGLFEIGIESGWW